MKKNVASGQGADQKDFIKIFQELCYSRQPWEVWADVITVMACSIANAVGMMAYVQLSLLGCPGYIVIANSLTNPVIGSPLQPAEQEGQEFWYTPLYFSQVWHYRRLYASLDAIFGEWEGQKVEDQSALLQPSGWFIFDFNDEKQGGYKVG